MSMYLIIYKINDQNNCSEKIKDAIENLDYQHFREGAYMVASEKGQAELLEDLYRVVKSSDEIIVAEMSEEGSALQGLNCLWMRQRIDN